MWIKLKGLENPISFDGAEVLVDILRDVLRGWDLNEVPSGSGTPRIRLSAGPRGYERRSPWIEDGDAVALMDPVDAVCDLLLDLERAYIEDTQGLLALHAAGVEFGANEERGLVVFPSTHATGKSLLTIALAHAGLRVFADDQLPIVPGDETFAVAPGFLPRLRRPLPDGVGADLAAFVRSHEGPKSARFRYVDLKPEVLAPLGTRAPVKAVVLLERQAGAKPEIAPVTEAEVLKACVLQSFGRKLGALQVLDYLHAMVQGATCVKLTYGEAFDAVPLLRETFA